MPIRARAATLVAWPGKPPDPVGWTDADRPIRIGAAGGASDLAPDHTMAAFAAAAEMGLELVVATVRASADGVAVLMRDATVDRTTPQRGRVSDHLAVALATLDAGSWFGDQFGSQRVPSLDRFACGIEAHGRLGALLDIGDPRTLEAAVTRLQTSPSPWLFAIRSASSAVIDRAHDRLPGTATFRSLTGLELADPVAAAGACRAAGIAASAGEIGAAAIARARSAGLMVVVDGIADVATLHRIRAAGVSLAIVDRPYGIMREGGTA